MNWLCFLFISGICANELYLPQQIHLSYTNRSDEMMITWVTLLNPVIAQVKYSPATGFPRELRTVSSTNIVRFIDGGPLQRSLFINRVLLRGLNHGEEYKYICGTERYGWSDIYFFT